MPTPLEWVEYFYPYIFDGSDLRYVPQSEVDMALAVGMDFRPDCLTEDRQNQAQAHYAAYLIEFRRRLQASGLSTSLATATVAGPIKKKTEGDVSIEYSTSGSSSQSTIKEQLSGPGTPYAAWQALWEICVPPIVEGEERIIRGGIITRFGFP